MEIKIKNLDNKYTSELLPYLLKDLFLLGYETIPSNETNAIYLTRLTDINSDRRILREIYNKSKIEKIKKNINAIKSIEELIFPYGFSNTHQIDINQISPNIRSVDLRKKAYPSIADKAIIDYARYYQTISSRRSVGRENIYIIEDIGQENKPLIGVVILSSPFYFASKRDEVLNWNNEQNEHNNEIKRFGLNRTMHVSVCCAFPPYDQLGAARLLALIPFTKFVKEDFCERWFNPLTNNDPDLALLTTTTSMGPTGTPFQNLRTSTFVSNEDKNYLSGKWNPKGKIYAGLGCTHPWISGVEIHSQNNTTDLSFVLSDTSIFHIEKLADSLGFEKRSNKEKLRIGLNHIGINMATFKGNNIGFLFGALDISSLHSLRDGAPRSFRPILDWNLALNWFNNRISPPLLDSTHNYQISYAENNARKSRIARFMKSAVTDFRLSKIPTSLS